MNNKNHKYLKKFIIFLIILTLLVVPATFASDDYFTLPSIEKNINITDDGTAIISENVEYGISGTVNGVYRDVAISGGQYLDNISVETPGYYNTLEVINSSNSVRLKVYLYKDEAKTQKVSDENVQVIYKYNFIKGVKIYNDIAEFQYIVFDKSWGTGVDKLSTQIQLPGNHNNIEMWYNPPYLTKESTWTNDNTLKTVFQDNIDGDQSIEQRMLIPKEYFTSTDNADVINKDAKATIEKQQKEYEDSINTNNTISLVLTVLMILAMVTPVGIYYKYGREPKIDYNAEYESDLPTSDSPAFVNVMIHDVVGEVDILGFHSTLLNLIDKGYYTIISGNEDDLVIKEKNKSLDNLQQYEIDIIDYLSKFKDKKNIISLQDMADSSQLYNFMNAWEIDVNRDVINLRVGDFFNGYGDKVMSFGAVLLLILGILSCFFCLMAEGEFHLLTFIVSIILIIESIILFVLPSTIMGQWTKEGKEFHDKWKNFERYIKDYSLIKEYPPESVQVWGKYMVYATALGCAQKASENMEKYFKYMNIPEEYYMESDAMFYSMYWADAMILSSIHHHNMEDADFDSGSFGDIGDIGGGFGGGGGGTF